MRILACLFVVACVSLSLPARADDLAAGRKVYLRNCLLCHGQKGHGDGPGAASLKPPPSDFSGTLKHGDSDEAMLKVINQGVPGTGMAGFAKTLSEADRKAVLSYIKSLRAGK